MNFIMPIRSGFILAAGLGTRMGEIGQLLPKVLWPVFESSLVEIQINFLKRLGVNDIALNTHHCAQMIADYINQRYKNITMLYEEQLLDSGGGVHNYLARKEHSKEVITLNSDQLIIADVASVFKRMQTLEDDRALLFLMKNSGDYSGLICLDGHLKKIENKSEKPMFIGLAIINTDEMNVVDGPSKFFETVANYQHEKVRAEFIEGLFFDFGTLQKYYESCFKLIDLEEKESIIDSQKLNIELRSYACDLPRVLNFSQRPLRHLWPKNTIVLKEPQSFIECDESPKVIFDTIVAKI